MVVVHDALPGWDRTDVQRILAVSGTAALLLAARRDAMHLQRHRLSSSIEELQLKTQALRDVATRISSQRESESRALGLELHDEVGQDMTALATRLRIAERTTADENARDELRALQAMVAAAHDHLRSVIRHLHPIALERFGLRRALCDGPLSEIAEDAGIAYRCDVEGPVEDLPLDVATAIYRICQEAVTNGIRHGCGEEIVVSLTLALAAPAPRLALTISDRAGAIDATPSRTGGLGLQGIRDRAHALGARYRFDPSAGAPRHRLELGLRMPDGPRPPGGATAA
jgi:two-component system sensor histidine kinase UhpB